MTPTHVVAPAAPNKLLAVLDAADALWLNVSVFVQGLQVRQLRLCKGKVTNDGHLSSEKLELASHRYSYDLSRNAQGKISVVDFSLEKDDWSGVMPALEALLALIRQTNFAPHKLILDDFPMEDIPLILKSLPSSVDSFKCFRTEVHAKALLDGLDAAPQIKDLNLVECDGHLPVSFFVKLRVLQLRSFRCYGLQVAVNDSVLEASSWASVEISRSQFSPDCLLRLLNSWLKRGRDIEPMLYLKAASSVPVDFWKKHFEANWETLEENDSFMEAQLQRDDGQALDLKLFRSHIPTLVVSRK